MSPALAGGFLTTAPPGKSTYFYLYVFPHKYFCGEKYTYKKHMYKVSLCSVLNVTNTLINEEVGKVKKGPIGEAMMELCCNLE